MPADDAEFWDAPPFSGDIVDGYIYGRGTIDDKHTVLVSHQTFYIFKMLLISSMNAIYFVLLC